MSTTYDIACTDCKIKLWIGQSSRIYSTDDALKELVVFLLVFVSEHDDGFAYYKEN